MLIPQTGSIFDSPASAWVNAVNCVGVMGKGLALEFKTRYPTMFSSYREACERRELIPGQLNIFDAGPDRHPRYIVNFPTKRHWRDASRLDDIRSGLDALKAEIVCRGIPSIALRALGCGLGGLPWEQVFRLIDEKLSSIEGVTAFIYPPQTPVVANHF